MAAASSTQFNFARLSVSHGDAAQRLKKYCRELGTLGDVGADVAKRIHNIGENIATFTLPEIYTYLDLPSNTVLIERDSARKLQVVNLIRNILILLPLALTWFALQEATILYQGDLLRTPADVNRPFLDLWQNGFGNPNLLLTFSHVALIDLVLYLVLISVGIVADNIVRRARAKARQLQELITAATDELSTLAISLSSNMPSNTTDVSRWMTQIQSVLTDATSLVARVGQQMSEFQASVTALGASAASLGASAATIGTSANELAGESRNLATSVQGISGSATQMASASGQISGEVRNLNTVMSGAVNGLTQSQQRGNDRLQQLVNQVQGVSTNAGRSADAIDHTVRTYGQTLRDAGRAQQGLVRRMEHIHRQQAAINSRLRGTGFWAWLFGGRDDRGWGNQTDDYYVDPVQQGTPAGHPPQPPGNQAGGPS